jgi:YesN/AraC family two-component response regulator
MSVSVLYFIFNPRLMSGIELLGVKDIDNLPSVKKKKSDKIEKSGQLISEQLTDFMDINKPYLNKISINDIAVSMQISPAKLALIIKENHNQSFTDFVNSYRLKSIDRQVLEKKHLKYSFEHMAYDAGFSSKNAFYRAFKKLRNTTPKKLYGIDD